MTLIKQKFCRGGRIKNQSVHGENEFLSWSTKGAASKPTAVGSSEDRPWGARGLLSRGLRQAPLIRLFEEHSRSTAGAVYGGLWPGALRHSKAAGSCHESVKNRHIYSVFR